MTIVTGTVTVNAAFLQELKEDNRELRGLLEQAAAFLESWRDDRATLRRLDELLADLRDQLAMHFSLEEAFGYFEDALEVAPRLCELADTLRAEHGVLFDEICTLAEEAEQLFYRETTARTIRHIVFAFADFQHRFSHHESRENELILQALHDDIGVGD